MCSRILRISLRRYWRRILSWPTKTTGTTLILHLKFLLLDSNQTMLPHLIHKSLAQNTWPQSSICLVQMRSLSTETVRKRLSITEWWINATSTECFTWVNSRTSSRSRTNLRSCVDLSSDETTTLSTNQLCWDTTMSMDSKMRILDLTWSPHEKSILPRSMSDTDHIYWSQALYQLWSTVKPSLSKSRSQCNTISQHGTLAVLLNNRSSKKIHLSFSHMILHETCDPSSMWLEVSDTLAHCLGSAPPKRESDETLKKRSHWTKRTSLFNKQLKWLAFSIHERTMTDLKTRNSMSKRSL